MHIDEAVPPFLLWDRQLWSTVHWEVWSFRFESEVEVGGDAAKVSFAVCCQP
jgi:hypothetical protein